MNTKTLTVRDALSEAKKDSVDVVIWKRAKIIVDHKLPETAETLLSKAELRALCTSRKTGVGEREICILG